MKTSWPRFHLPALVAAVALFVLTLPAKPPSATPTPTVTAPPAQATPASPEESPIPLPRLLNPSGNEGDYVVPLRELMQTATGVHVVPMDRKNPKDAAVIKLLGDSMNAVLPRMNQPKSEAETTSDGVRRNTVFALALTERFEARKSPDPGAVQIGGGTLGSGPFSFLEGRSGSDDLYPTFTAVYPGGERAYCVSVVFFETKHRESFDRAPRIVPEGLAALREKLGRETSCLLIAVETDGGYKAAAKFLNWEILDAGEMPVRADLSFKGSELPGLKYRLDDGRKGTD